MVRDKWYNYLIGGVLIILLYILFSIILSPIQQQLLNGNIKSNFIGIHISFAVLILIITAVHSYYNRIPLVKLFNWSSKINIGSIIWGFLIWFSLLLINLFFIVYNGEEKLQYTTNITETIHFLILSIFLTPIQITAEELLFRGYIISFLKRIKENNLFIIGVSSMIFASLHLFNPEVESKKLAFLFVYLLMSLFLTILTVYFKGLEYSLGIHFANNFFTINFLNYPNSPLPSNPLFLSLSKINPVESLISLLAIIAITSAIIILKEKLSDKKRHI